MASLSELLAQGTDGMFFGNRLILPFRCELLKVIIDDDIITDFSTSERGIVLRYADGFMDVYCLDYKNLKDAVSKFEAVKFIAVENGEDIFDEGKHIKFVVYLKEKNKTRIELADKDILFFE
ncbi:MAG: hypothetical protein IT279_05005 [Ignavibacteriaceae bacterium]|nr:hypothetical protein [Ignavibacteriaceae bacterium]